MNIQSMEVINNALGEQTLNFTSATMGSKGRKSTASKLKLKIRFCRLVKGDDYQSVLSSEQYKKGKASFWEQAV